MKLVGPFVVATLTTASIAATLPTHPTDPTLTRRDHDDSCRKWWRVLTAIPAVFWGPCIKDLIDQHKEEKGGKKHGDLPAGQPSRALEGETLAAPTPTGEDGIKIRVGGFSTELPAGGDQGMTIHMENFMAEPTEAPSGEFVVTGVVGATEAPAEATAVTTTWG